MAVGTLPLSLENLGNLDGGAAGPLIEEELRRAVADLDDRGDDERKRKVVVQVTMFKKEGQAFVSLAAQAKLPPRQTRDVRGRTRKERGVPRLLFDLAEEEEEPKESA